MAPVRSPWRSFCRRLWSHRRSSGQGFFETLENRRLLAAQPASFTFRQIALFDGTDGTNPNGTIVEDANGNIFGMTKKGGADGDGVLYEIVKGSSNVTLLASFDGTDGTTPSGGLIIDSNGNLFGVTSDGGANGDGVLFELAATDRSTIIPLASFDGTNGQKPSGDIIIDGSGNIWGTAGDGGTDGAGTLWEFSGGTLSAIYNFTNGADGSDPSGGVVFDGQGHLFGTSFEGGGSANGGDVWEFTIGGSTVTPLAAFDDASQGGNPEGGLAIDPAGNLFGTGLGSVSDVNDSDVWELPAGSSTIESLGFFLGSGSLFFGGFPESTPVLDSAGDLFGTTDFSGATIKALSTWFPPARGRRLLWRPSSPLPPKPPIPP